MEPPWRAAGNAIALRLAAVCRGGCLGVTVALAVAIAPWFTMVGHRVPCHAVASMAIAACARGIPWHCCHGLPCEHRRGIAGRKSSLYSACTVNYFFCGIAW